MSDRKHEIERPYPPDYVSAETLAYRLDLSRSTIDAYVRAGLLPKPEVIGNVQRWEFSEVRAFIKSRNQDSEALAMNGVSSVSDEYSVGIKRGAPA